MKGKIIIYGAGGLGREILSLILATQQWEPIGFIDDRLASQSEVAGLKILGHGESLFSYGEPLNLIIAIGDPKTKAAIVKRIQRPNINYPILIHPSAILQDALTIQVGSGSIITAGCILTTSISIGKHVLINLNTTVGHDVGISDYCSIMPGVNVAGDVRIGENVLVGAGANLRNKINLGAHCTVGMGAVVLQDVKEGSTVAGVPAKLLYT